MEESGGISLEQYFVLSQYFIALFSYFTLHMDIKKYFLVKEIVDPLPTYLNI